MQRQFPRHWAQGTSLRRAADALLLAVLGAAVLGCADDTQGGDGFAKSSTYGQPRAIPQGQPRFLAVIGGDYKSSALSLLDLGPIQPGDLQTIPPRWSAVLHSGSQLGATSLTLSGDVVLGHGDPQQRQVLLVDRGNGAITQVDAVSAAVMRQVSVSPGFFANPQDALAIDADRWLVSRMGRNPKPNTDPSDHDEGDDVLSLDPMSGKVILSLPLTERSTLPGGVAAPQRLAVVGASVWLPLGSFAPDFKAQGPARLVAIDPQTLQVQKQIDLPEQKNCVTPRALADGRLLLACQGSYASPAAQLAESALLVLDPDDVSIKLAIQALAKDGPWSRDVVALDARWAAAVTLGDFATQRPDQLWLIDLTTGARVKLSSSTEPFGYSGLWADPWRRQLWLGESKASADLMRIGIDAAGTPTMGARLASNPGSLGALELGGL